MSLSKAMARPMLQVSRRMVTETKSRHNFYPFIPRGMARRTPPGSISFRRTIHNQHHPEYEQYESNEISLRPLLFGLGACLGLFWVADTTTRRYDALYNELASKLRPLRSQSLVALGIIEREKQRTLATLTNMNIPRFVLETYVYLKDWYSEHDDAYKAALVLIALNTIPFLAWNIPAARVQLFMARNFLTYPGVNRSYTLLTSVFSHQVSIHFLCCKPIT